MKAKQIMISLILSCAVMLGTIVLKNNQKDLKNANAATTSYTLVGTFNSWNNTSTYDMTDSDGDGIYTYSSSINIPSKSDWFLKVAEDHAWSKTYGGDDLLIKPINVNVWTVTSGDGTGNAGFWNTTDSNISVKVYFRASDHNIFVIPSSLSLTFKTFYLNQNTTWTDWTNPRIHYWGNGFETVWNHAPTMTNLNETFTKNNITGNLYSLQIPTVATGLLAIKSNLDDSSKTANLDISSGNINVAHFYYDEGESQNCLYGYSVVESSTGAYLRGDWADGWNVSGQIAMISSSQSGPYSASGINLSAGSAVKSLYITNGIVEHWCQFNSVSSNDDDHYPVIEIDDDMGGYNAGVQSTGTYNVTVTKNANGKWDYAFEGTANTDLDAAVAFANTFVSTMHAECPYNSSTESYNTGKTSSTLATAWGLQVSAYADLDPNAKPYLLDKDSNITAITTFFGVYDYVYGHYATVRGVTGADFLSRNPAEVASYSATPLAMNNTTDATIIIVVVSSISLIALGGFFFIRKRKEDR